MDTSPTDTVRTAFQAFLKNDAKAVEDLIHPDLEWTFLDPSSPDPEPSTCYGRREIETASARWASMGLATELEEIDAHGDQVVVVLHAPGLDQFRDRKADDRNFHLVTVRGGKITVIRACRDRSEARKLAGLS